MFCSTTTMTELRVMLPKKFWKRTSVRGKRLPLNFPWADGVTNQLKCCVDIRPVRVSTVAMLNPSRCWDCWWLLMVRREGHTLVVGGRMQLRVQLVVRKCNWTFMDRTRVLNNIATTKKNTVRSIAYLYEKVYIEGIDLRQLWILYVEYPKVTAKAHESWQGM